MTDDPERGTYSIYVLDASGLQKDGRDIPNCDLAWAKGIALDVHRSVMSSRSRYSHDEINPKKWPFTVLLARDGTWVAQFDGRGWVAPPQALANITAK